MLVEVLPCDVVPAFSLGCRFGFENAFSRPIKLPIVGVLGACRGAVSDPEPTDDVDLPPHPEKSSGVVGPPGDVMDGRRPIPCCEKWSLFEVP